MRLFKTPVYARTSHHNQGSLRHICHEFSSWLVFESLKNSQRGTRPPPFTLQAKCTHSSTITVGLHSHSGASFPPTCHFHTSFSRATWLRLWFALNFQISHYNFNSCSFDGWYTDFELAALGHSLPPAFFGPPPHQEGKSRDQRPYTFQVWTQPRRIN